MTIKKITSLLILAIGLILSIGGKAKAGIVTSTASITGVPAMIAAPAISGQVNVLDGCMISVSTTAAQNACVNIQGANSGDPEIKLCANIGQTVTLGRGYFNPNGRNAGNIAAIFGQNFASTGAITAENDTATEAGILVTCSFHIQSLR